MGFLAGRPAGQAARQLADILVKVIEAVQLFRHTPAVLQAFTQLRQDSGRFREAVSKLFKDPCKSWVHGLLQIGFRFASGLLAAPR